MQQQDEMAKSPEAPEHNIWRGPVTSEEQAIAILHSVAYSARFFGFLLLISGGMWLLRDFSDDILDTYSLVSSAILLLFGYGFYTFSEKMKKHPTKTLASRLLVFTIVALLVILTFGGFGWFFLVMLYTANRGRVASKKLPA